MNFFTLAFQTKESQNLFYQNIKILDIQLKKTLIIILLFLNLGSFNHFFQTYCNSESFYLLISSVFLKKFENVFNYLHILI